MSSDPFKPLDGARRDAGTGKGMPPRSVAVAVPPDGPKPPGRHYEKGKPSATWPYRDAAGADMGYACRFDEKDGGKTFLPLTWCQDGKKMALEIMGRTASALWP